MTNQLGLEFASPPDETVTTIAEERRSREEQAKRDILQQMKAKRGAWLETMRTELAGIYESRVIQWGEATAYVTADDARNQMRAYPEKFALPAGASTNTLGALFLTRDWVPLDVDHAGRAIALHVSTTPGSRGNHLVRWKQAGARRQAA